MSVGRFRHQVTVIQVTTTTDDLGAPIEQETTIATPWASIEPLSGKEYWEARQVAAEVSVRMRMQYNSTIADAGPTLRVTHDGKTYDVNAVLNTGGRNRKLHLMCTRRL